MKWQSLLPSTVMTCSYFLHFLSECGSYFLGYIIPGVSGKKMLGRMRFNGWNLCDKVILWGLGKREDEAAGRELLSFQVSFNHFNLSEASCSHLAHHKKKGRNKGKASCRWRWSTQTLEMVRQRRWRWTDLTWWCPWCWGCSGTGPGTDARRTRTCWRSRRAAGPFW